MYITVLSPLTKYNVSDTKVDPVAKYLQTIYYILVLIIQRRKLSKKKGAVAHDTILF